MSNHNLTAQERTISSQLRQANPDLPGLFAFRDGAWIVHCNLPRGTGVGSSPEEAVSDMRDYMAEGALA